MGMGNVGGLDICFGDYGGVMGAWDGWTVVCCRDRAFPVSTTNHGIPDNYPMK